MAALTYPELSKPPQNRAQRSLKATFVLLQDHEQLRIGVMDFNVE